MCLLLQLLNPFCRFFPVAGFGIETRQNISEFYFKLD